MTYVHGVDCPICAEPAAADDLDHQCPPWRQPDLKGILNTAPLSAFDTPARVPRNTGRDLTTHRDTPNPTTDSGGTVGP